MDSDRPAAYADTSFSRGPAPLPRSRSRDVSRRTRRYLINMGIRMVCLLLMLVVPGGWKLVMLAGAVLIPLFAVMFANDQDLAGTSPHGTVQTTPPTLALTHSTPADFTPTLVLEADGTYSEATATGKGEVNSGSRRLDPNRGPRAGSSAKEVK